VEMRILVTPDSDGCGYRGQDVRVRFSSTLREAALIAPYQPQ